MTENVKIKINEYDKTSPVGSGTDSTDIAFIPGFSVLTSAPKNTPTLVTSTVEFEKLFGKEPRVLTTKDITGYEDYGFTVAGEVDKSYVYAKELLLQGMPVLYSNIVDDTKYTDLAISENTLMFNPNKTPKYMEIESNDSGIVLTSSIDRESEEIEFQFATNVSAGTDPEVKTTTFEYVVSSDDCTIVSCSVDEESFKNAKSVVTSLSSTQYEFASSEQESFEVSIAVKVKVTMNKGESVKIYIKSPTASALDVFYGENPLINNQLEISTIENPISNTISDKSVYSVKYITSGGYPSVLSSDTYAPALATKMLKAAHARGDAVALIDYQLDADQRVFTVGDDDSFYAKMSSLFAGADFTEYGAAMYPWATYTCRGTLPAGKARIKMPASFAYLMCVAKAIKSSPNWLAMAGVTRGVVPNIDSLCVPNGVISNAIAEEMQPKFGATNHEISINTITNIRPYGLTLWGNRTLKPVSKDGTVALNFLNTRNMLSDIKKLLYTTAKSCMFEQNTTDLWIKFKGGIEPLLRKLKAGNGISDYQIVRGTTKYNGDPLTKGEIAAVIKVYPMYAVEYFELSVEINDEEVTVS